MIRKRSSTVWRGAVGKVPARVTRWPPTLHQVRFDVAGDGQPGYGNGTEALSEEMERNGSAMPTFLAPSPDPTEHYIEQLFLHQVSLTDFELMCGFNLTRNPTYAIMGLPLIGCPPQPVRGIYF